MVDNNMNFEEYKLYLTKQYSRQNKHEAYMWLNALKVYANVKSPMAEKKQSKWEQLLDEVKNKPIKSRKNK